ncbi:chaplin [Streptomyces sp. NPDC059373]
MKRLSKAAVLTVAAGAAILGTAGGAVAHDGHSGASAEAKAIGSPGVLSGNVIQVPVNVPINVCGNSIDLILAIANPAIGNVCINGGGGGHHEDRGHDRDRGHDNGHDNNWGHDDRGHDNNWGHDNGHDRGHDNGHDWDHNHH